jgi:hypothetical protein
MKFTSLFRRRPTLPDFSTMTQAQFVASMTELCEKGMLTCTRGNPGEDGAQYALAWMPLDHPENFSAEVREQHAANMLRIASQEQS